MKNDFRVLYVEDDDLVRETFSEILNTYFSNLHVTKDGETALELYTKEKFDIVILDIVLPKIDGLSVAKKIKEIDTDTEIIILTAFSDNDILLRAVKLQLFSYLLKPIKASELDITLKNVIAKLSENSKIKLQYNYHWDADLEKLYYNDSEIKISKNEKKMISFLSTHSDRYYTACEIAYELLDNLKYDDVKCNNIVQLISRFKKKMFNLHKDERFFIENVYGLGYKINS